MSAAVATPASDLPTLLRALDQLDPARAPLTDRVAQSCEQAGWAVSPQAIEAAVSCVTHLVPHEEPVQNHSGKPSALFFSGMAVLALVAAVAGAWEGKNLADALVSALGSLPRCAGTCD